MAGGWQEHATQGYGHFMQSYHYTYADTTACEAPCVTGSYRMIWVRLALQRLYLFIYFILDVCVSYVLRLAVCMSLHFVASSSDNLA